MSSDRYRTVVRRYRVRHQQIVVLVLALSAALILGVGFILGRQAAFSGISIDPQRYREQGAALQAARAEEDNLGRQLGVLVARHEVDRAALELVRQELAGQKEQIAGLEEGIRFYRSLMAPGEIAQGFSLREIELVAREEPRRYGFRIVAQQEARKHRPLQGELYAEVSGQQAGAPRSYPLAELSADLESTILPLRFRYFQSIEGDLVLPEGFEPRAVSVVATLSAPSKAEAREQYPWRVQEKFTHAGK
ncbi:hypothetical protein Q6D67_19365 [Haliea sp. E1-2-M8]|uniref:DUF6776 family protein n=1 Tax=Haliea sp. E1-2-M8 TaxID=3064706 RepID=UPI0027281846|nr:DUF6776 family protein [Haliea sp. E1-2-M8]MDO8863853.1 hypothetical protein [Haliea sp. E1-2-M8]